MSRLVILLAALWLLMANPCFASTRVEGELKEVDETAERVERLHVFLNSRPVFSQEPEPETPEERSIRLKPVAVVTWAATTLRPPGFTRLQWAAVLLALASHESNFARYVQTGKCETGPEGMRCDGGKARGLWQQWEVACPAAWQREPGSTEELWEGAKCASRLMYSAYTRCSGKAPTLLQGAFSGYRGGRVNHCTWKRAAGREKTAFDFTARLRA